MADWLDVLSDEQKLKDESTKKASELIERFGLLFSADIGQVFEEIHQHLEKSLPGMQYTLESGSNAAPVPSLWWRIIQTYRDYDGDEIRLVVSLSISPYDLYPKLNPKVGIILDGGDKSSNGREEDFSVDWLKQKSLIHLRKEFGLDRPY